MTMRVLAVTCVVSGEAVGAVTHRQLQGGSSNFMDSIISIFDNNANDKAEGGQEVLGDIFHDLDKEGDGVDLDDVKDKVDEHGLGDFFGGIFGGNHIGDSVDKAVEGGQDVLGDILQDLDKEGDGVDLDDVKDKVDEHGLGDFFGGIFGGNHIGDSVDKAVEGGQDVLGDILQDLDKEGDGVDLDDVKDKVHEVFDNAKGVDGEDLKEVLANLLSDKAGRVRDVVRALVDLKDDHFENIVDVVVPWFGNVTKFISEVVDDTSAHGDDFLESMRPFLGDVKKHVTTFLDNASNDTGDLVDSLTEHAEGPLRKVCESDVGLDIEMLATFCCEKFKLRCEGDETTTKTLSGTTGTVSTTETEAPQAKDNSHQESGGNIATPFGIVVIVMTFLAVTVFVGCVAVYICGKRQQSHRSFEESASDTQRTSVDESHIGTARQGRRSRPLPVK